MSTATADAKPTDAEPKVTASDTRESASASDGDLMKGFGA